MPSARRQAWCPCKWSWGAKTHASCAGVCLGRARAGGTHAVVCRSVYVCVFILGREGVHEGGSISHRLQVCERGVHQGFCMTSHYDKLCVCVVCCGSDADLSLAASNIIKGGFSYSGQRCTAVKVVLVVDQVADELVKMVSEVSRLSHRETTPLKHPQHSCTTI